MLGVTQEEAADADAPAVCLSSESNDHLLLKSEGSSASRRGTKESNRRLRWQSDRSSTAPSIEVSRYATEGSMGTLAADDPGADGDGGTTSKSNSMVLMLTISEKLRRWRSRMSQEEEPTEQESLRGVQVQRTYDFYDSVARKIRVRKMFDDVLHARASQRVEQEATEDGSDSSTSVSILSSATSSTTGTPSEERSQDEEDGGAVGRRASRRMRKANSHTNQERAAMWGVLVAGLVHKHHAAVDVVFGDIAIVRRKLSADCQSEPRTVNDIAASVLVRARSVVQRAELLAESVLEDGRDSLDADWEWAEDAKLLEHLFGEEYLDTIFLLANAVRKTVARQPVLAEVEAPCRVFGDIHGQLRDLLYLLAAFGLPSCGNAPCIVFNGDFVDRGKHQVSTLGLLLALKVVFPEKVWLIRGNHEDRNMNERYGFQDECGRIFGDRFGPKVFENFHKVFDQLPVACLISKRVLVLHGGLGDGQWALRDLRAIRRPLGARELGDPANRWILNLLWSDPIEEDDNSRGGVFGVHPSPRGQVGLCFAWDLTRQFCARNGLGLIVRSHQSKQGSVGFDVMHDKMLVRVFSARDYEEHGNDGAVLLVQRSHTSDLLTVRPQVLRSVTKASDEAVVRKRDAQLEGDGRPSRRRPTRRETMAMRRSSIRREAMFRNARQVPGSSALEEGEQPIGAKGWLWRLKEHGRRMHANDWVWDEIAISRRGSLVLLNAEDQGPDVLVECLATSRCTKVASHEASRPYAFQIVYQRGDGELGRLMLAAETSQLRSKWLGDVRKLSQED